MSKNEKIRSISTSKNGNLFAVSELNKFIQIWDVEKGFVSSLTTDLDGNAESPVSISEDGLQLAVVGYDQNTVSLYDINKNIIVWQQKAFLNPVNVIILNYYDDTIFLDTEDQGSFFFK